MELVLEQSRKMKSFMGGSLVHKQESSIIIVLVLYVTMVSFRNPAFISQGGNVFNILHSSGFSLITIVGMTLILITGGLDLSVGSVLALGGVVTGGMACQAGIPVPIAMVLGVMAGVAIGCINGGGIIVKTGIPPLIVTLGMQYAARGLVSVTTKGIPIYPLPKDFTFISTLKPLGIPMVVVVALCIAIFFQVVLKMTSFGRAVYAVGGNEEAAKISGINTRVTKFRVYVLTSSLAALAGVFMAARLGSAEAAAGTGYELTVICGAIIGGTSTFGGSGSIFGAILGGLFMEVLTNSLT